MFHPPPLLIEVEGVRLLREERDRGDVAGKAEEAPGPPGESEHLQRKSTGRLKGTYIFSG
ncbi:hypothetical protein ABN702_22080 [Bacillus haimaensis]